jgi:hypothetical protein
MRLSGVELRLGEFNPTPFFFGQIESEEMVAEAKAKGKNDRHHLRSHVLFLIG